MNLEEKISKLLKNKKYKKIKQTIISANVKNVSLSTMGINNVKIVDMNNNVISNIDSVNQFKILIPRASITENKELLLNFRVEARQTSVMFGATTLSDRQNMGLMLYPVNFRNVQDRINVKYITSKINLTKVDKDTGKGIAGVTFLFETLNGKNHGEFITNANGIIELDVQKNPNILSEKKIKVTEIKAPENYILDENYYRVDITENNMTYNVENDIGKGFANKIMTGNIKINKSSEDGKLDGFTFKVTGIDVRGYSFESEYLTDENGVIYIEDLPIREYKVEEILNESSNRYIIPEAQNI